MSEKRALWIKDPLSILADAAERGVVVREGRIVELVPAGRTPVTPDTASFDAGAHVVLPGLINTHHHFCQTLTRATPAALDRELFPWLQALYPIWARLTPEALDLAATLAMSELLLSGCTTSTDHHYVFPKGLDEAIDIEITAAKALGIRVLLTRGSMNLSQRDGGLPPDSVVQDEDAILDDSQRLIERYHERGEDAMVQIALAPCSPFSVTTSLMRSTAALASQKKSDCILTSPKPRMRTAIAKTSMAAARLTISRIADGSASGRGSPMEFTSSADEMMRLARAGTTISHCPCSNQVLASGCCPVCDLERAGVRVGIGVDGSASNDGSNLIQEVRAAFLIQRSRYGVSAVSHRDALRWATKGSAACIGRPELGEIRAGKIADLALFKLDELRFSGAGDPLAALVLCGAHKADRVMIGGEWVVEDGRIGCLNTDDLARRHSTAARRLQGSEP